MKQEDMIDRNKLAAAAKRPTKKKPKDKVRSDSLRICRSFFSLD
jgi:hypothetical protein